MLRSPPRRRPLPGSGRSEFDPHSNGRNHTHLLGDPEQQVHLVQLLDHDEDGVPKLLAHQCEPDELFVLVAVTDDDVIAPLAER